MEKKVLHRLKEIRLGLNLSREDFAKLLGDDWYFRKVERLENGHTRMNDVLAQEITRKLDIPFESMWIKPDQSLKDNLQEPFEAAPEHVQKTIKTLLGIEE